ncbi:MAG: peptidylprolyl isomerase [Bdellovibrio sp. ArHS]|uniref:peptidylprolyl isomerase n=1 Tax=Bdellovibrio sp. ArHS TaxID=1569284 RepID=UPI00058252EB|nr:peptidylprolyl isomerase [Bdellovibrio sp. ArHS]KHD87407.1 MAG: peptidylprolyl isomerase [Bdellovibrio sp. ArHS]
MKIRASHVLVKHQYEAEDVLRALNLGKSFEELAKRYSTCPSGAQGGDLGVFGPGRMDQDFEEAAFALKVDETVAKPVRTRFGYHIIKRTK